MTHSQTQCGDSNKQRRKEYNSACTIHQTEMPSRVFFREQVHTPKRWNSKKGNESYRLIPIQIIVTYWPSNEPSIKRCTCINKQKNSGSRWMSDNYITRRTDGLRQLESVGDKMPNWEPAADRGLWILSDPRLSNPSQDEKEVLLWSEELGSICSSLSPSPTHLSHTTNINPFRE